MAINIKQLGRPRPCKIQTKSETTTNLRSENRELREKWNNLLQICCNAESEVEYLSKRLAETKRDLNAVDGSWEKKVELLQETIETMDLQLADTDEKFRRLTYDLFTVKSEFDAAKVAHTKALADVESRLVNVVRAHDNLSSNYKHAIEHKTSQDKLIADVTVVVHKLREENLQLKADAEHLAKKLVQKNNEYEGLVTEVSHLRCPFQKTKDIIHIQCGKCSACKLEAAYNIITGLENSRKVLENQNHKLRARISSHFQCDGIVSGEIGRMCGGCSECQLQQTRHILEQTSKNIIETNKTIVQLKESNTHYDDCLKQQHTVNANLQKTNDVIAHINGIFRAALFKIANGSFFKRSVAQDALTMAKNKEDEGCKQL